MSSLRSLALAALLANSYLASADSGTGTTTRYWDCCKPSCAWNDLSTLGISSSVKSCDANDQPLSTNTDQSACAGGTAYMCSDQSPWQVTDDLAYGFAAVSSSNAACCQCYELTFTGSSAVAGKKMVVQATNTGNDVGSTQFDLAMPGGGFGQFDACTKEWNATSAVWGAQYGGPATDTCSQFPCALQPGCGFRWGAFFQGSDNPTVSWQTVACPKEITDKSGCVRTGDTPTPGVAATAPAATEVGGVCEVSSASVPAVSASSSASAAASSTPAASPSPASSSSADSGSGSYSSMILTLSASSTAAPEATSTTSSAEPEETGDDGDDGCDAGFDDQDL